MYWQYKFIIKKTCLIGCKCLKSNVSYLAKILERVVTLEQTLLITKASLMHTCYFPLIFAQFLVAPGLPGSQTYSYR